MVERRRFPERIGMAIETLLGKLTKNMVRRQCFIEDRLMAGIAIGRYSLKLAAGVTL
jgi:hypothetical protein